MALFVQRYRYDNTGVDPANLVTNEPHVLESTPIRLIQPNFGYFFTASVKLYDTNTQELIDDSKYTFMEYFEKESIACGKKICGSIVLTDDTLPNDLSITYQALGGLNSRSAKNVVDVHYDRLQDLITVDYKDLKDIPRQFTPTKGHKHPISTLYDIGKFAQQLGNIRDALLVGNSSSVNAVMDYINHIVSYLEDISYTKLDTALPDTLIKFRSQFTKQFFGLDNVTDATIAKDNESRNAVKEYFKQKNIDINKYLTLTSLVYIKESLFESVVSRADTNLDTYKPKYIIPTKDTVLATPNGANLSFVGLDAIRSSNILKDVDLYPPNTYSSKTLTINRVTNNQLNSGGIFTLVDQTAIEHYLGHHPDGDKTKNMSWKKTLIDGDLTKPNKVLADHITNVGNPHRDTKYSIGLNDVENIKVVNDYDIANMLSSRAYLTLDQLNAFMYLFEEQGMWKVQALDTSGKFLLDNCQVVYSECGKCGCSDRSDFPDVPAPAPTTCPAANTLVREFCSDSPTNVPSTGTTNLGVNRYGVYTDGNCGEVTRLIETNSLTCGYVPPATGATVEIRDGSGRLVGMGYGPKDDRDPNATVRLDDYDGKLVCFIYPRSGDGYDSAILDGDGSFVGFAINP